uniref:NAD(P)-binding domain-containing protein n=1 Tax=Chryseobacterium endophyticum TaxID=1854762 RepID=A0AAU6WJU9_9FLAO
MNKERLGFIGLGNMGHPMAKNLEKAGFQLSVYNRTPEKAQDFRESSIVCDSIADVVENSDILFTMLTHDEALREVFEDILSRDISGKLFVDMSTVSPEASSKIAGAVIIKEASLLMPRSPEAPSRQRKER